MNSRRAQWLLTMVGATSIALGRLRVRVGARQRPTAPAGETSLNGTSVLSEDACEHSGHEVRAAIRLNEELADWAGGIVRFAPYPGPPAEDEAAWYRDWLAGAPDRWLIYVVRDFDTVARVLEERGGRPRRGG